MFLNGIYFCVILESVFFKSVFYLLAFIEVRFPLSAIKQTFSWHVLLPYDAGSFVLCS